ncbi:TRAP transporter substrate-binding protein DctP [Pusillimonas sp. CC-YST705]|uniref:TRAP transporter substrate-binding protein DctP n=1 Tax=Mesopusillimonas faecipullorum TaxID=2755040 RepID=A0ABS8CE82_9BURK|nr:TRAP transporter substrate-binding protein DctP [Mesopusillimonas faecipullorum]MCB5364350.1 TRAP transporter substrate-binding protein DctP [Mesopusillimonas faecipullorum]
MISLNIKKAIYGVCISALALSGSVWAQTGKSDQVIRWTMQSTWAPGLEIQRQADAFAEKVKQMSGGRLQIKSLPSGSVVGGLQVFDAAEEGVIDAAYSAAFYWVGNQPVAPFFAAVPAGLTAIEYLMWLYHGPGMALWKEAYAKYDFGYVGAAGINNTEIFAWSNKPLKSLADFKGLKFRTVGYWGEILTGLGASVVTLPGSEIYGALERGVIDAAEFANPESDWVSGMHEVARYAYVPGIHQPTSLMELLINKESWGALPDDLKAIVEEAAKASVLEGLGNALVKDADALKKMEAYGTKIERLSPEIMREIASLAHQLYEKKSAENPLFKKIYESQMEYKKKYEYLQSYMEIKY